jgi:epoxyqueuosine reductase
MKQRVHTVDRPSYIIDPQQHGRFDQRKTVFGRMLHDENASFFGRSMYSAIPMIFEKENSEPSQLDFARVLASWTVYDYFHGAFSEEKLVEPNNIMTIPALQPYAVDDPGAMSLYLKDTARLFGASRAGICRLDHRWLYSHDMDGKPILIPEDYQYAIVMAIAMDRRAIATSPGYKASTETGKGYSRMAYCIACVAEFIRYLGYRALPAGNDIALSIPLAIDAGLGELGRLGLLITPEYGPCVRLCKLFTDLPLVTDRPITFGVTEYCSQCVKCADACAVKAISKEPKPSFKQMCISNNSGIKRWPVNHDQCYEFWIENGSDCSSCIAACPFSWIEPNTGYSV